MCASYDIHSELKEACRKTNLQNNTDYTGSNFYFNFPVEMTFLFSFIHRNWRQLLWCKINYYPVERYNNCDYPSVPRLVSETTICVPLMDASSRERELQYSQRWVRCLVSKRGRPRRGKAGFKLGEVGQAISALWCQAEDRSSSHATVVTPTRNKISFAVTLQVG